MLNGVDGPGFAAAIAISVALYKISELYFKHRK